MTFWQVSVEKIEDITPIPGRDKIVLGKVRGWQVIVRKDEFKNGDLGVFFPTDSLLPSNDPRFEFMRSREFRVKTMKMAGVISQGLFLPIAQFPELNPDQTDNLQDILHVTKYERPIEGESNRILPGHTAGLFFPDVQKSDQERVQNINDLLPDMFRDSGFEITEKLDGTSCTIKVTASSVEVASRNYRIKDDPEVKSTYWDAFRDFCPDSDNLIKPIDKLKEFAGKHFPNGGFALQGEIIGPAIQGNAYRLEKQRFYLYDIYDVNAKEYLDPHTRGTYFNLLKQFLDISHVPILEPMMFFLGNDNTRVSLQLLIDYAVNEGKSSRIFPGTKMEGVVFKGFNRVTLGNKKISFINKFPSFKVINNEWLLENE